MNTLKMLLTVTFLITVLLTCQDNTSSNQICKPIFGSNPYIALREHTNCKNLSGAIQTDTAVSECSFYQYFASDNILFLSHQNAAFNCNPGLISVKSEITEKSIKIWEMQSKAGAKCECLYDVDYEIRNLKPGLYIVEIFGPVADGSSIPPLTFSMDLNVTSQSTYCMERTGYPWEQ